MDRPRPEKPDFGSATRSLPYRPDIDGLRAVAVLAVVLYHLEWPGFEGGFAGVDVFFVISGFLITTILHGQLGAGDLSLAHFYARRIRRIAPALVVMLVLCSVAAWFVLLAPDLVRAGKSLAASTLLVSNLFFLKQGNYYSPVAQHQPFLHVWSLSVEEQFYLLYPWLLLVCAKWLRARYAACLAVLMAISFAFAIGLETYSVNAAFFFGAARAWELLLGALLVFAPAITSRGIASLAGALGAALVGVSIVGWPPQALSTVAALLVPCAGAALIILAGTHAANLTGRVLSARVLVAVGLISYSLYLWHWPVLVLYKALHPLDGGAGVEVLGVSVLLAAISWRYVEQPLRDTRWPVSRYFLVAGVAAIALLSLAAYLVVTDGGAARDSARVRYLYTFDNYPTHDLVREDHCFLGPRHRDLEDFDRRLCLHQVPGRPSYLLVGDSHAAHLWHGLAQAFPSASVLQATVSNCKPLFGPSGDGQCEAFVHDILGSAVPSMRPDAVILAARWTEADVPRLRETIRRLRQGGATVVVAGPIVEYGDALPRLLAIAEKRDDPRLIVRARTPGIARTDASLAAAVQESGGTYFSVYRALCPPAGSDCMTSTPAGAPVQFDYGHLTREGSEFIGSRMRETLALGAGPSRAGVVGDALEHAAGRTAQVKPRQPIDAADGILAANIGGGRKQRFANPFSAPRPVAERTEIHPLLAQRA
jgi:peptidoglycan/LPS O-acetylase OafA/YrhL